VLRLGDAGGGWRGVVGGWGLLAGLCVRACDMGWRPPPHSAPMPARPLEVGMGLFGSPPFPQRSSSATPPSPAWHPPPLTPPRLSSPLAWDRPPLWRGCWLSPSCPPTPPLPHPVRPRPPPPPPPRRPESGSLVAPPCVPGWWVPPICPARAIVPSSPLQLGRSSATSRRRPAACRQETCPP
jgi:hypothetical protein